MIAMSVHGRVLCFRKKIKWMGTDSCQIVVSYYLRQVYSQRRVIKVMCQFDVDNAWTTWTQQQYKSMNKFDIRRVYKNMFYVIFKHFFFSKTWQGTQLSNSLPKSYSFKFYF
jgi:hypothetical protein